MNPSTHELGAQVSGSSQQEPRTGGVRVPQAPAAQARPTWWAPREDEAGCPPLRSRGPRTHAGKEGDTREETTQGARQHPSREAVSAPHSPGLLR